MTIHPTITHPVAPTIAIVGRPNVGKSTLFNRLVGRRQSIVHDLPGVTRDRVVGRLALDGERNAHLIDTGGFLLDEDPLGLNQQVLLAIEESDLLVLVVDGKQGLVAADEEIVETLRRTGKPLVLAINKADTSQAQRGAQEFFSLGLEASILLSAEHGRGIGDLIEAVEARLPPDSIAAEDIDATTVAIVGRPNVGKSSLLNRLLGEERVLVSPVPGTTRDPIDTLIERQGQRYLFIDTAGIRRRSHASGLPEELAIMMARRQIERASIVVLVVDAAKGVTSGDLSIAGSIWELGRVGIVAVNKWDLLDEERREELETSWERLDEILSSPERVNISAKTGRAVDKLFPTLTRALEVLELELPTAEVNRIFERAARKHQPAALQGKPWNFLYATQVSKRPLTFMLFANRTLPRQSSYRRYLENQVRQALGLRGVPVRLVIRRR